MVKVEVPVTADWQRAAERAARMLALGLRPRRLSGEPGRGRYSVPSGSRTGEHYTTEVVDATRLEAMCSCPHGREAHAGRCWHAAACLSAEIRLLDEAQRAAELEWDTRQRRAPEPAPLADAPVWIADELHTPDSLRSLPAADLAAALAAAPAHPDLLAEQARRAKLARFERAFCSPR